MHPAAAEAGVPDEPRHQLAIFNGETEAQNYLNAGREGFFSLLIGSDVPQARKRQSTHRLVLLPKVLPLVDKTRDTWISQAEFFRPTRRLVNLARVGLLFSDIDCYKYEWARGRSPAQLAAATLYHCAEEGVPPPSLIVFSGRGLQAKWLLEATVPRQALPRWNACQQALVSILAPLGTDPGARDASRVLRLVHTVNSKSGQQCEVVHVEEDPAGHPVRYGFEYLAEALLPKARNELRDDARREKKPKTLRLVEGGRTDGLRSFAGNRLAWDRLEDLRQLARLRGGVHEGQRMTFLIWNLNFLLLSGVTHSSNMYFEAAELAKEIDPAWNYRSEELMTVYSKAKAFEAGESISFGGRQWPALYTPKNETLICLFQITDVEQRQLRTIISSQLAQERHRLREQQRRRLAGASERSEYEATSLSRRRPWEELGVSRATWYRSRKEATQHPNSCPTHACDP